MSNIDYDERDRKHREWIDERFEYFRKLGDKRADERKRIIEKIIIEHRFWLGFGRGQTFKNEAEAFFKREHKCGDVDNGVAFSNQIRTFCNKYLIDFDLVFFMAGWLNSSRLPEPDGGVGSSGGGFAPRALAVQVEPEPEPEPDAEEPKEFWEPSP